MGTQGSREVRVTVIFVNVKELQSQGLFCRLPWFAYVSYFIWFVTEASLVFQVPRLAYLSRKREEQL